MLINENLRKRLLKMIENELEYNPYDKELLKLKKELNNVNNKIILTENDISYMQNLNQAFIQIGVFKTDDFSKLSKQEIQNAIDIMKILLKIRELQKELYSLIVEHKAYNDKKEFFKYMDKYNLKILEQYMKIAEITN